MSYALLLSSLARHITLTGEEEAFFTSLITVRKVKKKQFLLHAGSMHRCTYFVNQGSVRAYFVDLNGHEHTIQLAIEGWWVSDLQSFILQQPALLNVEAIEDSQVLEIPAEKCICSTSGCPRWSGISALFSSGRLPPFSSACCRT
jgi:CRP-like cAMP-binding protein